ncbi:hypothetical protein [Wolbachia endosymbiont (group B) of Euphydryas aurinia]|uniref:hypothetical protein n=1 Tax=Wolbachia endosymbiont (group B) of Euphydryas aurinia TaxID=2954014 RepID=UPI002227506D|nr:hypothetical protein [Wolbachia endosymbiont (group B) of Euphydryas aurinia]
MLTANNQGKLKGKVKVPANIPAGTKLVQFYGDKGSYGEATYTGKKTIIAFLIIVGTNEEKQSRQPGEKI